MTGQNKPGSLSDLPLYSKSFKSKELFTLLEVNLFICTPRDISKVTDDV